MEHNAEISENTQQESVPVMKRTIKDSVFTNLFKDKKYLIQSQPYGLTTGSAGGLDEPLRGIFRYRL